MELCTYLDTLRKKYDFVRTDWGSCILATNDLRQSFFVEKRLVDTKPVTGYLVMTERIKETSEEQERLSRHKANPVSIDQ